MKNIDEFEQLKGWFKDPPAINRTAPLWVWNDLIAEEQIDFQLLELKNHGFGGAFVHPRPGLVTEYLSEEWFQKWGYALQTAKSLGMKLYIYDENSYPSGFAGGHVPSQLPDCLSTSATYKIKSLSDLKREGASDKDWTVDVKFLKAYACHVEEESQEVTGLTHDLTYVPMEQWSEFGSRFMILEFQEPQTMAWLGDFANVDVLRPEVTKAFLDSTYEAYYKRFGQDFGKDLPAIFTDEPAITGSRIYNMGKKDNIPFSYWLAAQFQERFGYSLLEHLPAIFKNIQCRWFVKKPEKVRYDYFSLIRELWTRNAIEPISRWCHEHGIAWTGHYLENFWPLATSMAVSPAMMANYEYHQWPAIDMLLSNILRNAPTDLLLVTILEINSVANQLGKERTLCETYGAGGWDSTLEDYKRIGDWLLVHGINFINQHLTYGTVAGARKRDHPQSFDWREPWWDDYTELNEYVARASTILTQGKAARRILVLHPTTTGYMVAPEEEDADLMWGKPPVSPDMQSYLQLLQYLTDQQWDFDLGDEYILERHASVREGRMAVANQTYDVILVSGDMKNLRSSTVKLMDKYFSAGGTAVSLGIPGPYIDGELAEEKYVELLNNSGWKTAKDLPEVNDLLKRHITPHIRSSVPFPTGLAHMRRELESGKTVYFFVNHSLGEFNSMLELKGGHAEKWNLWTGAQEAVKYSGAQDSIEIPVSLKRNESLLLLVDQWELPHAEISGEMESLEEQFAELKFSDFSVSREDMNVLTMDYCDLEVDGKTYRDINTIEAGKLLFQLRGFKSNPWDNAVQFKRRLLDRNHFGANSGFSVSYNFKAGEDLGEGPLQLIVERAEFYSLKVNGQPVQWSEGIHWLDHHNGVADIRSYVKKGRNTITITAGDFNIFLEVEAAYLRGDFSVDTVKGEWTLGAARVPTLGTWIGQGHPFYPGAFLYTYQLDISGSTGRVTAELPQYEATACTLHVNGKRVRLLDIDGRKEVELTSYLQQGINQVTFRLCGSLKNLLGPHHDPDLPRRTAWPQMWRKAPKFGQPAAESYDLIGYGLDEHVKFKATAKSKNDRALGDMT